MLASDTVANVRAIKNRLRILSSFLGDKACETSLGCLGALKDATDVVKDTAVAFNQLRITIYTESLPKVFDPLILPLLPMQLQLLTRAGARIRRYGYVRRTEAPKPSSEKYLCGLLSRMDARRLRFLPVNGMPQSNRCRLSCWNQADRRGHLLDIGNAPPGCSDFRRPG